MATDTSAADGNGWGDGEGCSVWARGRHGRIMDEAGSSDRAEEAIAKGVQETDVHGWGGVRLMMIMDDDHEYYPL